MEKWNYFNGYIYGIYVRVYDIYERHYSVRNKAMSHPFKTTSLASKRYISLIHPEINNYRNYLHAYL